jgi:hypothetical protein
MAGSDPEEPMLPGNLKSAFDDDVLAKPKQRVVLCGIQRSNFFILLVLFLFLIRVGVTVGVGVGLGMSKTGNSSPFSKRPQETASSTGSAPAQQTRHSTRTDGVEINFSGTRGSRAGQRFETSVALGFKSDVQASLNKVDFKQKVQWISLLCLQRRRLAAQYQNHTTILGWFFTSWLRAA